MQFKIRYWNFFVFFNPNLIKATIISINSRVCDPTVPIPFCSSIKRDAYLCSFLAFADKQKGILREGIKLAVNRTVQNRKVCKGCFPVSVFQKKKKRIQTR